ncbi:hypothetical protein J7K19_11030, partial [bacterium]|nr:hypothetical protein [bacterium]
VLYCYLKSLTFDTAANAFWGQFFSKHVVSNETLVCPDRDKMLVANKTGHLFEVPLGTICLFYFS